MTYDTGNPLWGLDYARISTILWGVVKNQQHRIDKLELATTVKSTAKATVKKKT